MSTSKKIPATIRQGGPGSSRQDATAPLDINKPTADADHRSHTSGGGGERDSHHTHAPDSKGGHPRPA